MAETRSSSVAGTLEWASTFPVDLHVEKESYDFAYRLIQCTSAFILDKRGFWEEKYFKTRNIDKLLIPVFDKSNPSAGRVIQIIEALREAIKLRRLREFAIVFFQQPDDQKAAEIFSFRLLYGNEGEIELSVDSGIGSEELNKNLAEAKFTNLEETKKMFVNTMKQLNRCIKHMEPLPPGTDASFRISFTDETPKDYLPGGFDESSSFYQLDEDVIKGQIGVISSGHQSLQILASSRFLMSGKTIDCNQTLNSLNTSLIAPMKTKVTKSAQKKSDRVEKHHPYGSSTPLPKKSV